jgi:hypothetical protein
MAERSVLTQRVQLGLESTYGTAVAATKRLPSLEFTVGDNLETQRYRGSGYKIPTIVAPAREWAQGDAKGPITYTEIVYLLASALRTPPSPTQITPPSGTAYRWTFTPTSNAPDAFSSFTLEYGDSSIGHRVAGLVFTNLKLDISRERAEVSANWIGKALEHPFTLTTSGVTDLNNVPAIGTQWAFFIADTPSGLSNTANKLTRGFSASFTYPERYSPVWVVDRAQSSYVAIGERPTEPTVEITLEADSAGMAYLANARQGDRRYIRLQALGSTIEGSTTYELTIDLSGQITSISALKAEDTVVAITYTFTVVHSPTWSSGQYMQVQVVNTQTSL